MVSVVNSLEECGGQVALPEDGVEVLGPMRLIHLTYFFGKGAIGEHELNASRM